MHDGLPTILTFVHNVVELGGKVAKPVTAVRDCALTSVSDFQTISSHVGVDF